MKVSGIGIYEGEPSLPYSDVGEIKAKVGALTFFHAAPTYEQINRKLQEEANRRGANAIVNVSYKRGITSSSWKGLTATGTAVILESDEKQCPFCAETVKREAIRCKHCGSDLVNA